MCLGLTCQVVTVDGGLASVRCSGREQMVSLMTLEEPVAPGDWVLVHSGFALARLTDAQATEALAIREATEEVPS